MGLLSAARDVRTIKQLLTTAEFEARAFGDELPGPEPLLLSALALPDGSASRAFVAAGADPSTLRAAIERSHAEALASVGLEADEARTPSEATSPTGVFRSTPMAQRVFQDATAMSKRGKASSLLGAHVAAAVCDLERGTVARALAAQGVDRATLRLAARHEAGLAE